MLRITKQAAAHLEELRTEKGFDGPVGVRFVRNGSRLGLTFARTPEKGYGVVPRDGIAVYLAPGCRRRPSGRATEDQGTTLVLRRRAMAR